MIILQLKSSQEVGALKSISHIIKSLRKKFDYRVRGHEIHQMLINMKKTSLTERVKDVSAFSAKNEIEYLTYHAPIIKKNIFDRKWNQIIVDSIYDTMRESERVIAEVDMKRVTIIFHLTNYIHRYNSDNTQVTKETKFDLLNISSRAFLQSFVDNTDYSPNTLSRELSFMAIENSYPKYYLDYAAINLFHPTELVEFERYNIKTALDLAHYQLYSNYLTYGKGNFVGDIEREIYSRAPAWEECVAILANSLVQLHISDAAGFSSSGEGLRLKKGEIPITSILKNVNSLGRTIQGTIELKKGHLHEGLFQMEAANWLLTNVRDVF